MTNHRLRTPSPFEHEPEHEDEHEGNQSLITFHGLLLVLLELVVLLVLLF
jgi:hypothetical protein